MVRLYTFLITHKVVSFITAFSVILFLSAGSLIYIDRVFQSKNTFLVPNSTAVVYDKVSSLNSIALSPESQSEPINYKQIATTTGPLTLEQKPKIESLSYTNPFLPGLVINYTSD